MKRSMEIFNWINDLEEYILHPTQEPKDKSTLEHFAWVVRKQEMKDSLINRHISVLQDKWKTEDNTIKRKVSNFFFRRRFKWLR